MSDYITKKQNGILTIEKDGRVLVQKTPTYNPDTGEQDGERVTREHYDDLVKTREQQVLDLAITDAKLADAIALGISETEPEPVAPEELLDGEEEPR